MSEGEKIQFTGNLALLRVCAIVFIVNLLNIVVNMSIIAARGGFFSSLWSALTNSSFEDCRFTCTGNICACQKKCDGSKNIGSAVSCLGYHERVHH